VLRTNLSTRPFYNERVVHLLIALAGVIVLTVTLFNVMKVIQLSRHNTELATVIGHDRSETERLTREATRIRRGIDQKELAGVAAAAREANDLIDQRTFSWTAFFNDLEATLPPEVMIVSVRPVVDRGATRISLTVVGRTAEDIDEFIEKLEGTGDFESILAKQTDRTEDGLNRAVLDAEYAPHHEASEAAAPEAAPPAAPAAPAPPKTGKPASPPASRPAPPSGRSGDAPDQGGQW
jgi:Tfp pilus assembly protein PilN